MQFETLATLVRFRRLTVENARRALADALNEQDEAEREATDAERAIREETERATDTDSGDGVVEAFATWLPGGRRRLATAHSALDHAVARAAQARTVLALARTALEAADTLGAEQRGHAERAEQRRDAQALDEVTRHAHRAS